MTLRPWMAFLLAAGAAASRADAQPGSVHGTVSVERGRPEGAVVLLIPDRPTRVPPLEEPVVIDQVDLRFVPQVVAVPPGSTVAFPNSDPIMHNVFSPRGPGDGFNLGTYPPSETRSRRFTEPGLHVILCHVHPEMVAYVAVVPTPYYVVVGESGGFAVEVMPVGRYTLRVWHGRRPELEREVAVPEAGSIRVDVLLQSGR